jgi:hypothetical protein
LEIEEVIFIKLSNYYMHYFLLHSKEEIMTIVLILGKSKHIKKDHLTRCLDGLIMKKRDIDRNRISKHQEYFYDKKMTKALRRW